MNHLSINENTLTQLQTFESIEEMDEAIKSHKQAHDLTQAQRDILDAISRYACKHKGVSYLSKQKLAEDAGYKSRRTAIRACNRLEELGIIEQYETRRIKGDRRRSSNIIVINNVFVTDSQHGDNTAVTSDSHGIEAPYKTIKNNTYKETEKRASQPIDYIKRGLKNAIPSPIYEALAPFYDGQGLYDAYGLLLRAKARIDRSIVLESHSQRYIDAFYNVIRRYKRGIVRNLDGYLFAAWERLSAEISRQKGVHDADILAYNPYEH